MMLRRLNPSVTSASEYMPSSSGPRCAMRSVIRRITSTPAGAPSPYRNVPPIPHLVPRRAGAPRSRRAGQSLRGPPPYPQAGLAELADGRQLGRELIDRRIVGGLTILTSRKRRVDDAAQECVGGA